MVRPVIFGFFAACAIGLGTIGYIETASLIKADRPAPSTAVVANKPFVMETGSKVDLTSLRAAAAGQPGNAEASANLGMGALAQSDFASAQTALEQSVARDPSRAGVWSALGETYLHVDRSQSAQMPARARAAFDKALALDPHDIRARFYNALEKDAQGQHDVAIVAWLAMLREVPRGSHADGAIRAAIVASIKNNITLVRRALDRVTAAQPSGKLTN